MFVAGANSIHSGEQMALEELKAELIKQAGCLGPPVCRGILDMLAWQSGSRDGCSWLPHFYLLLVLG